MTQRIAMAILLIVWLALLAAGVSTYVLTRSQVLANLDETILSRIASLPELERPASLPGAPADARDRWVIRNEADKRVYGAPPTQPASRDAALTVQAAGFTVLADGTRLRWLKVQAYLKRDGPEEALLPVTVLYSASAQRVDTLLGRLLYSLAGFGVLAVLGTALAARSVARAALAPMRQAVAVIQSIDEQSLDQRVAVDHLPKELAPMGERLNELLARLETAFGQRKQFLADASHELRTPVAALVTTLEVGLRRRREPEEYVRTLERCLSDARLLNRLVEGLLDQVRSERFASGDALAPLPLSSVLGQCVDMLQSLAQAKGISLRREIRDVVVLSDEMRLRSMVMNLLSNAVEYTPEGGHVTLKVQLVAADGDAGGVEAARRVLPESMGAASGRLVVRVEDDGPGIRVQDLPHVFEPFYRADASRGEQHLGLGLSLVQAHARALGGTCTVESPTIQQGSPHGSAFVIDLPVVEVTAPSLISENNNIRHPAEMSLGVPS